MILAEAWSEGFRGFDVKLAYESVRKNATVPQTEDATRDWGDRGLFGRYPETRGGLSWYQALGYVACDKVKESVPRTQDFALDDYFKRLFFRPERGNLSIQGNEPSHHTAYLYNAIGKQWKTAAQVREIALRSYNAGKKGFDGNEDCGQMSA
jgi:putative alpha-1,2-mannosidase